MLRASSTTVVQCPDCDIWLVGVSAAAKVLTCMACDTPLTKATGVWTPVVPSAPPMTDRAKVSKATGWPMMYLPDGKLVPVCAVCLGPCQWNGDCWGSWVTGKARRTTLECADLSDHSWQSKQMYGVSRAWTPRKAGMFEIRKSGYLCHACSADEPTWQAKQKS